MQTRKIMIKIAMKATDLRGLFSTLITFIFLAAHKNFTPTLANFTFNPLNPKVKEKPP